MLHKYSGYSAEQIVTPNYAKISETFLENVRDDEIRRKLERNIV